MLRGRNVERPFSLTRSNDWAVGMLVAAALIIALIVPAVFYVTQMARIETRAVLALNAHIAKGVDDPLSLVPDVRVLDMPFGGVRDKSEAEEALLKTIQQLTPTEIVLAENDIRHLQRGAVDVYYFIEPLSDNGNSYRVYFCDVSFSSDAAKGGTAGMAALGLAFAVLVILLGRKSKQLLQRKDEALNTFFSNASHELKTPLAVIGSQVEAAQWGALEVEDALKSIQSATERMAVTVDALMDMSRVEAGVVQPVMRRHDVREDVYDVVVEMEQLFKEKGIALDLEAVAPAYVIGDREMMFSIVQNLLSNALRYAAHRVTVTVAVRDDGRAVIEVINDGVSLTEGETLIVFDRFATGNGGKTGIGLALAAEYACIQGGDIEASPMPEGTRMAVAFPCS